MVNRLYFKPTFVFFFYIYRVFKIIIWIMIINDENPYGHSPLWNSYGCLLLWNSNGYLPLFISLSFNDHHFNDY